jgi:hypothetical protein
MTNKDAEPSGSRVPAERRESEFGAGLRILFSTPLGLGILLAIVAMLLLPYSEFCISKFRFLSDEDAVQWIPTMPILALAKWERDDDARLFVASFG